MTEVKERGQASILISLNNGVITIEHGTDKVTLLEWTANNGDWDKIWEVLNEFKGKA